MGGQIINAAAATQDGEEAKIKAGRTPEIGTAKPRNLPGRTATRSTIKVAKPTAAEAKQVDIAVPAFEYKNHLGTDRRHGLFRIWLTANAAHHGEAQRPALVSQASTASDL